MISWLEVRKWILSKARPFIELMTQFSSPSPGSITPNQIGAVLDLLQPGDVILTRREGELSNYIIPGFYSHVGIYTEFEDVIEARGEGVKRTHIEDFLKTKDFIGVYRYRHADAAALRVVARRAITFVGARYDYGFELGDEDFYCSELAWQAFHDILLEEFKFTKRDIFGVETVIPTDFSAVTHWENIISCIGKGPA